MTVDTGEVAPWYDPRISRYRIKTMPIPKTAMWFQARNGLTHEEFPPTEVVLDDDHVDFQSCEDTIRNPGYYLVFQDPPLDDGGEFTCVKTRYVRGATGITSPWVHSNRCWGDLVPNITEYIHEGVGIWYSKVGFQPDLDTEQSGTHLWRLARPAQPSFSVLNFIAELRELPRLLYFRLKDISSIGDWYLASKFGWEALFRDIQGMYKTYLRISEQIEFLIKNNGVPIHRRLSLPLETISEVLQSETGVCGISLNTAPRFDVPSNYEQAGYRRLSFTKDVKTWFSGNFVFYLNDGGIPFNDTPEERRRLRLLLLGAKLTPAVIWEALPWSWLVDYFVNVGDVLANLSAEVADRQLTTHAYVMRKTTRMYKVEGSDGYFSASAKRYFVTSVRRKVDPYGLNPDEELSIKQQIILVALGLSRA